MATTTVKLLQKEDIANDTLLLRLEKPEDFVFEAGQTIDLALPSLEPLDPKGNLRAFSLASAPHEPYLEVATRIRESAYKLALKGVPEGTAFELEGPFGSFTLHEDASRAAIILVGGIGITPFRSMVRDVLDKKTGHTLYLFYSNRRPEDAAFLDELTAISENEKNIFVIPTMTEIKSSVETWEGETGYITYETVQKYIHDAPNPIYYMAGPQGMVLAMRDMLKEHAVSKDDIKFEEFPGY